MTARNIAQKISLWVVLGLIGFIISVELKSCNEAIGAGDRGKIGTNPIIPLT